MEEMLPSPWDLWHLRQRDSWDGRLYWNLTQYVEPLFRLHPAIVEQVVRELLSYHEWLRIRIKKVQQEYYYFFASPDEDIPFSHIDLSSVPTAGQQQVIEKLALDYQISLNLIDGPVIQVVLFNLDQQVSQRLLLVVSHTVCDAYSLQLLMNDFIILYSQLSRGESPNLPPKTTSLKILLEKQWQYARSQEFQQELQYWHDLPWEKVQPLRVDVPDKKEANTRDSVQTVSTSLSVQETNRLLRTLPKIKATILDLLLTAWLQTLAQWTGTHTHAFFLVHHGRTTPFSEVKLSRTVGNLITTPQLVLDIGGTHTEEESLRAVQRQLCQVPNNGMMWKWLPIKITLSSDLAFNYLGQQQSSDSENARWFRHAPESSGPREDPQGKLWTLLLCTSLISKKQMYIHWDYSTNLYRKETIEQLANEYIENLRCFLAI